MKNIQRPAKIGLESEEFFKFSFFFLNWTFKHVVLLGFNYIAVKLSIKLIINLDMLSKLKINLDCLKH